MLIRMCAEIILTKINQSTAYLSYAISTAVMHNITLSMLLSLQRSSIYLVKGELDYQDCDIKISMQQFKEQCIACS